jgi:hypothetical protein
MEYPLLISARDHREAVRKARDRWERKYRILKVQRASQ